MKTVVWATDVVPGDANKGSITLSSSDGGMFTTQPTVVPLGLCSAVCEWFLAWARATTALCEGETTAVSRNEVA